MRRAAKVKLGSLCKKGHDHEGTGMSLRHASGHCAQCFSEARDRRMADPAKREREMLRQKKRDAKRPKKTPRPAKTLERRREINRKSKAKARALRSAEVRASAREFYKKNSLRIRIRNRVSKAIRQQRAEKVLTVDGYGIDVAAIILHLGPCPGEDWHIDHVRPLAWFDLSDPQQVKEAFCPENHQWLPSTENLRKGARYASVRQS